ncbi:cilia- and flagella-associated protein 263-like [Synchiropus picturatus]
MDERRKEISYEERNEVQRRVQEAKDSIAALHAENDLFDTFIRRFCPQTQEDPTSHPENESTCSSDDLPQLTLTQKVYVSQKVVEATRQSLEELKQHHESLQTNSKIMSKEAEMRLARIKKERSDFERRIQSKTINELSAMETKKVLQSIFGNTKSSQLVKLVGYNQVLKDKRRKLLMQLQRPDKEDHFQDQREENVDRNSDELQIKYSKIQRNLNSHKDKLQSVLHQSAELSHVIAKKEKQLRKVEDDLKSAEEVCEL